jgi:hypothetical protein
MFTIIDDVWWQLSTTIKIYSDSMHICVWGNFSNVSTILPLYMTDLFWGCGNITYSCYQSNREWLKSYWKRILRFSICYVEIQLHRVSKFQVVMHFFIWQSFAFQLNHINQIRHVQQHYEALLVVNIPLICCLIFWLTTHVYI